MNELNQQLPEFKKYFIVICHDNGERKRSANTPENVTLTEAYRIRNWATKEVAGVIRYGVRMQRD